ncbi:hypothetical protein VSX64_11450 [Aurantimonas sp. C2-6-R+9]|uniref:hypothetical protein n=1 Tax=unclassified Aurantimonas TaxID=2638230 RepID=UPI002E18D94D|nr:MULTISPECIES: hypothetical protein [unclassified Aurantimonas]MEC5291166.1 hypothetical protein [Aurantimonas sp. C2-3-R2]MEC5381493.1 hypothetical protein [Aurantimonas sp. C2-6-R+9]MEC5411872.1 hypothetical protein [Aurantimonas sp. C2-4-R8]
MNSQPGVQHRIRRLRVGRDHAGVERGRGRHTAFGEKLENARQAGPHPVVGPTEIRHIRNGLLAVRRRDDRPRHRLVELPVLDVDDEVNENALALHRRQHRPFGGQAIGNAGIAHA